MGNLITLKKGTVVSLDKTLYRLEEDVLTSTEVRDEKQYPWETGGIEDDS